MKSILALILFYAHFAYSSSLPKGNAPGPGKKYKFIYEKDEGVDCHTYHMNPESGDIVFDSSGESAYFFGKHPQLGASTTPTSDLIKLSLSSLTIKKLARLNTNGQSKIILHGSPVNSASLLSFRKGTSGCGQGEAKGVGVKWEGSRKVIKTYDKSYYKLVRTDSGVNLLDSKTATIRNYDLATSQSRILDRLPKKGIPLYIDRDSGLAYHYLPEQLGALIRFNYKKLELESKMKLAEGMKLVQQGGEFAVAKLDPEKKSIVINKIKGWSGDRYQKFEVFPKFLPQDRVRTELDFESSVTVLMGRTEADAYAHRGVEIHNGAKGELIEFLKPPESYFFSNIALSLDGRKLIILAKHEDDYSLGAVSVYDLEKKKVTQVHLE